MTERGWSMLRDRTGSPGTRSSEELVGECHHRHRVWHVQLLRTCTMGEGWFGSIRSYNYIVGGPPYSRKFFVMHNHVHYSLYNQLIMHFSRIVTFPWKPWKLEPSNISCYTITILLSKQCCTVLTLDRIHVYCLLTVFPFPASSRLLVWSPYWWMIIPSWRWE